MANHQLAQKQLLPPQKATLRRRSAKPAAASQRLSRSKAANVHQPLRKSASPTKVNPFIKLIQKRPLLIWSSAWAAMLLVAIVAILGLANPGSMKTIESSETVENSTVAENPVPQEVQNRSQLPSWLFGLAGLGCATGSWVIIKQVKGSRRRRRLRKPLKSAAFTTQQPDRQQPQTKQQKTNGSSSKRVVPKQKVSQRPVAGKLALADGAKKPTPIPQKQSKNNKSENGKLAESMDLRKRHPLSSFLRKL